MSGSTTDATPGPGNRILAMGIPPAMLFFEPQKTMAISSSRLNPSQRQATVVATSTAARRTVSKARTRRRSIRSILPQIPATMPSLKAA